MRRVVHALAAVCLLAACGRASTAGSGPAGDGRRLSVVTTVAPLTSIAATIAGGHATVTGVVPEGTNSHTFEPKPSVAKVLSQADLVFVNGLGLEDPTKELARENLRDGAEIIELGNRTITPGEYVYDFSFPREGGRPNPHLWTNPPMAKRYAEVMAEAMAEHDPDHAEGYRENLAHFAAAADELDGAMRTATATVPAEHRRLLTYHDAYAYFAREYGWQVIGAIQPSSFDEPSPREVAGLIEQIRAERVPAVFGSEVFPSPVLAQIARETGVRYVDVLRDDDLPGRPGGPGHSWLGLMRFDFVTMVESLGGDPSALEGLDVGDPAPDRATYPQ
jgi:ABC-type Zn uptake system ZnuABC Zn-binding protein ZnuA